MIEAIAKRTSIRSFTDKKVEAEKVESLLRAAMRAPSGINGQPWEFVVVDDREVLTAMQKLSPGTPGQAALAQLLGLPENVKPYSIVGIGYPAEDADLDAVDRFDAGRIHYNKY